MNVRDLNKKQLTELKIDYYHEHVNNKPSYNELANIDNLVNDNIIFEYYESFYFVEDDF